MCAASGRGGRYVVAIDFGTTFSGFAFLQKSDPQQRIFKFYDWPDAKNAGGKEYCKTLTALYYEGNPTNGYDLVDWGWPALEACSKAMELSREADPQGTPPELRQSGVTTFKLAAPRAGYSSSDCFGCYVVQFKLDLLPRAGASKRLQLPGDLTTERLIVDYLRNLGELIMTELRGKYSNNLCKEAVEWCLTVPSIWDERAKQVMKVCAEKAGLVVGDQCPTPSEASPHPLDIILEPEGASVYCQQQAKTELQLRKGDKLLIADVGGGTIDLVVHIKAEDDPASNTVKEQVASYGDLGGGTFVDIAFFDLLSERIGCFEAFCRQDPATRLRISKWWQDNKTGFQGGRHCAFLPVYGKLKKAWKEHDHACARQRSTEEDDDDDDDDHYSHVMLEERDFCRIFDPEVDKVLDLIKRHVKDVKVLMVVGGFATSRYLRQRLGEKFRHVVPQIVVPPEPGSAICYGAVQLHLQPHNIQSRIQRRTLGLSMARTWKKGDPKELQMQCDGTTMCSHFFDVFVRRGDTVPREEQVVKTYIPLTAKQKEMELALYSTESKDPEFTTEPGVEQEGRFKINIEKGLELGKARQVEVIMVFGASFLQLSAACKNFGDRSRVEHVFPITFL